MPQHEAKICPSCGASFECKVGTILTCQCNGIVLSEAQKETLKNTYSDDCLCRACLLEVGSSC